MERNHQVRILSLLFLTSLAFAEPPLLDNGQQKKEISLPRTFDLANIEPKWSTGKLDLRLPEGKELLPFGSESELMGVGFIFKPEVVPPAFQKQAGEYRFFQILLSKKGNAAPFSSILIQAENFKLKEQSFKVSMSKEDPKKAWMMIASPKVKENLSNEEKLKGTYFGAQGVIKIAFLGNAQTTEITLNEKKLSFQIQKMNVNFNTILSTPFNTAKGDLSGAVTIPVLWAEEQTSLEQLSQLLASQSANEKSIPKDKQEAIQNHKREISGSSREKR